MPSLLLPVAQLLRKVQDYYIGCLLVMQRPDVTEGSLSNGISEIGCGFCL